MLKSAKANKLRFFLQSAHQEKSQFVSDIRSDCLRVAVDFKHEFESMQCNTVVIHKIVHVQDDFRGVKLEESVPN